MIFFLLFYFIIRFFLRGLRVPSYGDVLGWTKEGVISFSNYKKDGKQRSYAGEKWECVEFVRRFLMTTRGITFDEIDHAYDIFNLSSFQTIDGKRIPIVKNNKKQYKPERGDVLVWGKDEDKNGHVAMVVETKENGDILIAEQNWENEEWGDRHYSRIIRVESEPNLMGWIKI